MHLIRCATLTVTSLEAANAYCEHLDYTPVETGSVSQDLARSWQTDKLSGAPYTVLQPASGANVFIRMVEQPAPQSYKPMTTHGWAAAEICTQDTHTVNARMENTDDFEIIGPPKELDGMPAIFPMQVKGKDNEVIYLTEIRADLEEYDLPRAASLIDKLFILVLACPDMEREGAWLEKHLALTQGRTMEINYSMINNAFGLPDGTQHKLATLKHERDVFLEIDQYPEAPTPRDTLPGFLPPCIAIGSFHHPDFGELENINQGEWLTTPMNHDGIVYGGKKSACLRSPGGTLFEMIEA